MPCRGCCCVRTEAAINILSVISILPHCPPLLLPPTAHTTSPSRLDARLLPLSRWWSSLAPQPSRSRVEARSRWSSQVIPGPALITATKPDQPLFTPWPASLLPLPAESRELPLLAQFKLSPPPTPRWPALLSSHFTYLPITRDSTSYVRMIRLIKKVFSKHIIRCRIVNIFSMNLLKVSHVIILPV